MVAPAPIERVQRHLETGLRLVSYGRSAKPGPTRTAVTPVIDPHVHQLLRSIRGIRRRYNIHTQALPSLRD